MEDRLAPAGPRWLLLVHQLPPKPSYFRVKIWRRLQRLGAVALKNSVYVLPRSDGAQEDFQWVRREITEGGGDAFLCEALFVEGLSDGQIEALFHAARAEDYGAIGEEVQQLAAALESAPEDGEVRAQAEAEATRLRRRFDEVSSIDFFGTSQRESLGAQLAALQAQLRGALSGAAARGGPPAEFCGRTWVTRRSVGIDRIASAWLIRRFIDPQAEFVFVVGNAYRPASGELRFDMFDAEFTHEGDRCTFEVLLQRFGLCEPALAALGEIVHDIDLKDAKFGRPETAGINHLVEGIGLAHKDDEARLERGEAVFTDLYAYFQRKAERDRALPGEVK